MDVGPGSHMHGKKHAKSSMLGSLHQSCSVGNKFDLQAEMGLESDDRLFESIQVSSGFLAEP
ncbi:hypothetical protein IEO21_07892 [Rhodonia placenta]|uniref:Uncharacterized protein n=2 Tax=Rhodonia placenta TaxID=104341 RepID=A0A8H7NX79_9APHY|nr:hypothetical protein IEO21_07892 [Postia placenta]